jgi:hypothetical protein
VLLVLSAVYRARVNTSDILLGRVGLFSHIGKSDLYGPTMSLCVTMMSKGVHYIAFSVTPDVWNTLEHTRIIHMTLIRVTPMDVRNVAT